MITRVQVKNFRSLADIDVSLGKLTILVGRNGAGKSALIDVFRFVRDALTMGLESSIDERHGVGSLRRWAKTRPFDIEMRFTVELPNTSGEYLLAISSAPGGTYKVKRELCRGFSRSGKEQDGFEIRNGKWVRLPNRLKKNSDDRVPKYTERTLALSNLYALSPTLMTIRRHFIGNNFYSIFPNTLREPQKPSGDQYLHDHGENFASVLRLLREDDSKFPEFLEILSRVIDGVSDVQVQQIGGYLVSSLKHSDLVGLNDDNGPWFELFQESDGTLRLLGMLVALFQLKKGSNRLIAIEEPENSLHPGALGLLSEVLYEQSFNKQILVTTQSPDLISQVRHEDILVVERLLGATHIARIESSQQQAIADQLFTTGDLLRIEGLRPTLF